MSNVTTLVPKSRDFTWPGCAHPVDENGGVCLHLFHENRPGVIEPHEPCNRPEQHAADCPWVLGITYAEAMSRASHDDHDDFIPGCRGCEAAMNEEPAADR